jgi:uncharacterized protein DUF3592
VKETNVEREEKPLTYPHRKEYLDMFRRKRLTLDGGLLFVLLILGISAIELLVSTSLLWHGVAAQGVITGVVTVRCPRSSERQLFSVQFTDRTGQGYTSTISQCDYEAFNVSPGDSVAIVYLPDNPTIIAPPDGLMVNARLNLYATILLGLITLLLLPFWIRKRIRKASLQRQEEQAAAERWRAREGHVANPTGDQQD